MRSWDSLSPEEKYKIWKYLEEHFFDKNVKHEWADPDADSNGYYYVFFGEYFEKGKRKRAVHGSISALNYLYKAKSYATSFLESPLLTSACADFYRIYSNNGENVVFEMLSMYSKLLILGRKDINLRQKEGEGEEEFELRIEAAQYEFFDKFAKDFNSVFSDFGLNVELTRLGLIPRQDKKIDDEIVRPVIAILAHPQWSEVSVLLSDAFSEYQKGTPGGYSNSVTNTVAAVQAFLQIKVNGKVGIGDISKLIPQAQSKKVIPEDSFTKEMFKTIESILMRERQETGVAHPKKEYATEKNARLVLNLAMIFFQHCL